MAPAFHQQGDGVHHVQKQRNRRVFIQDGTLKSKVLHETFVGDFGYPQTERLLLEELVGDF